jgi:DNA-binding transcriptional ArsR family regulator
MVVSATAIDRTLWALADPHRRAVVDLLRDRPRPAGDLARAVGLPAPAMSRHLRTLRESGLVEDRHDDLDARVRVYALRSGAITELMDWLSQIEALWATQLTAFRDHLEASDAPPDRS